MKCEICIDLISARLDGALTAQEEAALTAHLNECPACRAIAEDMKQLHSALAGLGDVDAPAELSAGVMSQIKQAKQRSRRLIRQLSGLAACFVLCAAAWYAALSGISSESDPQMLSMARHADPLPASLTDEDQRVANEQRLRLSGMTTSFEPYADLLGNAEDLSGLLARFPYNDLSTVAESYDEEYFRNHRLLAVVVCEPSSSISHAITRLTEESVTILRTVPEADDSDMTLWLILAEVDGAGLQTPLAVELLTN